MADRRSFRFSKSTQRRITPRKPSSPPQSVSTRSPSPKTEAPIVSQPATVTAASLKAPPTSEPENQEPGPSTITNEPITPPSREVQTAVPSTNNATTPTNLVDEPQTSSLSHSTSQSRALSQPAASPSRRTSQSRSPPQPLSPSRVSPKTRSTASSPHPKASQTPSTPQKKSLPRFPSHLTSHSPKLASSPSIKRVQPSSPSQESKRSISKSNVASDVTNEEDPKPEASQHEPFQPSAQPRGETVPLYKKIREDLSTFVNKMAIGDLESGVHDKPVSVITLAGENQGASMHLGSDSSRSEGPIHIHRSYKIDTTLDSDSHSKYANKMENPRTLDDQPAETYVNNNAQSINNSMVFNCSISERNPGVHMVLVNVPKESIKAPNIQKVEFSTTTADKVMYEPSIRRRCLQGLFLEASNSETEHMEKPTHHGCRVERKTRDKDDEIDVL